MDKQDFAVMHGWMLKKVPNDELSKIKLAEVEMNGLTPSKITKERSLRLQDLNLIMTQIIDTSYLQSSKIQYLGFDEIIKAFIQHTKLDEKGRFSLREDVLTSMAAINSFFASILVAGHRLIETCEKSIKA